jgi:hypothetical protein
LILESYRDAAQKQEVINTYLVSKPQCPTENAIGMVDQCQ